MDTVQFLTQTPLFADIPGPQLKPIAQDVRSRRFRPGEIIFHEGDSGQFLYLVQSGQVRIFVNGLDGSEMSVILFGKPGDIFGELAVIDGLTRSASAVLLRRPSSCRTESIRRSIASSLGARIAARWGLRLSLSIVMVLRMIES